MNDDQKTPVFRLTQVAEYDDFRKAIADEVAAAESPEVAAIMFISTACDAALPYLGPQGLDAVLCNARAALRQIVRGPAS